MRINDVLSQLKVGDVEYRKLGDIITFLNGRAYKQTELLSSGKYKVVRVGNFFTNDKWYYSDLELEDNKYCNNGDLLYCWAASLGPQIWTGDKTIFHYHIWKLEFDETVISKRYLYHFLKKDVDDIYNSLTQSTMPHVSMASMKERIIPIPPMEIQSEIVKVLDNFTELTAELTVELTARKKQYEYYRDLLLDFGVHGGGADDCEWRTIKEVANIKAGKAISASQISSIQDKEHMIKCYGGNGLRGYVKAFSHSGEYPIIGRQGALCGNVNYAIGDIYATEHAVVVESKGELSQRFLYYFLISMNLNQYKSKGAQPGLAVGNIEKLPIPVPPIEEQERIVSILDRFDKLCNDISEGLPKEIELRKKQYEYYRDKLLSFSAK